MYITNIEKPSDQKYTIHRSLDLKISEVKNVFSGEKQQNTYCTVHINDDEVRRTPTVYNSTSPIFSEHFEFNPLIPNFQQLKIIVWSDVTEKNDQNLDKNDNSNSLSFALPSTINGDKAIGQITFPLGFLKSGAFQKEQWFVLQPTFDTINKYNVTGDIRIEVSHTMNPDKTHRFEINVKQANDLIRDSNGSLPDPYVACYLLPDIEGKTAQLTTVKKNTINPVFNSKIVYNVENVTENLEINVSIWNWNKLSTNEFLGHCFVSLSDIPINSSVDKRYTLLSKPARIYHSIKNKGKGTLKSKKRFTIVDGDTKLNHRQFIQRLQRSDQKDNVPTTKRSHRLLDTKFYSISFCGHCGGIIWVTKTHLKCGNCNFCCHHQCAKYVSDNCGGVVTLLLKITYNESYVLPIEFYNSFLNIINENKYYLIELFGKLSNEREAAALSLIKIQLKYDNLFDCLKSLIEIEVAEAESSQTLFRANSMVSKIIDVYMKYTGLDYLSAILKDIIHNIVENDIYIEVDPSKAVDTEQKKINESLYYLTKYLENILTSIFQAEQAIPKDWRKIFNFIQEKVIEKFPTEYNVRFTSIAGFIFLRFFAPSVLGPKLFGLIKTYVSERNTRTFTLLAKVIQTLANLSDFNEKELYMCPLNDYINAKIASMKKYLSDICDTTVESRYSNEYLNPLSDQLTAYECSKLLKYFTNVESKLIESITCENVLLLKKYIDVSANLMEYVNELKKMDEANEENLKKKKLSEDISAKTSMTTLISEKTIIGNGSVIDVPVEKSHSESQITLDDEKRGSTMSLLNDENVNYISEFYKNNNVGESIKIKNKGKISRDTIYESTDENLKIDQSSESVNDDDNDGIKKLTKTMVSGSAITLAPHSQKTDTIKQAKPMNVPANNSNNNSEQSLEDKKKRDRQKVLAMLKNIPQVGGLDFTNLQSTSNDVTSAPIDNNRDTIIPNNSPFDTVPGSAKTISKSPFDTGTPVSAKTVTKSPFSPSSNSPFNSPKKSPTKSPFDSDPESYDARKTIVSPYDSLRKASVSPSVIPSSPFDVARKTSVAPSSPFDTTRKTSIAPSSPFDTTRKTSITPSSPFDTTRKTSVAPSSPFDIPRKTSVAPSSPFDTTRKTSITPSSPFDTTRKTSVAPSSPFDTTRKTSITPSSPFDTTRKTSVAPSSPFDTTRKTSVAPSSPFDTTRKTSVAPSSPFDVSRRISTLKPSPSLPESSKINSLDIPEEIRRKLSENDLIPSTSIPISTSDYNVFNKAQNRIKTLSIAPAQNPLDEEETIDIPESEIQDEIQAKIDKNIKYCCMCRMQILLEFITFDNEKMYHPDCFRCQRCDEVLTSDNCYKKDEKYYCKKCYLFEEGYCCNECEEIIEGPAININGKLYHQHCFVCTACGDNLNKQYMVIDGRPYCKKDYLKYKGFMCGICGEFIENEYITIFDRKYHLNCKRCSICGETFNNKSFFSLPQDPYEVYCDVHKVELCTCHSCHKPIENQMIRTVKKPTSYHIHCFKCSKCEKSLQGIDYFEKEQEVYCRDCYIATFI